RHRILLEVDNVGTADDQIACDTIHTRVNTDAILDAVKRRILNVLDLDSITRAAGFEKRDTLEAVSVSVALRIAVDRQILNLRVARVHRVDDRIARYRGNRDWRWQRRIGLYDRAQLALAEQSEILGYSHLTDVHS